MSSPSHRGRPILSTLLLLLILCTAASAAASSSSSSPTAAVFEQQVNVPPPINVQHEILRRNLRHSITRFFAQKSTDRPSTIKPLQQWIRQASLPEHESALQHLVRDALLNELKMDHVDMWTLDEQRDQLEHNENFVNPRSWDSLAKSPNVVGFWFPDDNDDGEIGGSENHVVIDAVDASQQQAEAKQPQAEKQEKANALEAFLSKIKSRAANSNNNNNKKPSYKTVVLNGHVDVVPVGTNLSAWINGDPFSGDYDASTDRIYGRGTTDMKGGNFANFLALQSIQYALEEHHLKKLPNTLVMYQSVIEEESGGAGTLAAVLRHRALFPDDAASHSSQQCIGIATEPTQLKLFTAQQGSMWFRITVLGKQAHGATRYYGISAIEHAIFVIQTLQRLEQERNAKVSVPVPINIGKINGGDWPSSVPDRVVLEGRIGIIPDPIETMQQAKDALRSALENSPEMKENNVKWSLEFFGARWPPAFCPANHSFIDHLKGAYSEMMDKETVVGEREFSEKITVSSSPWATDAGYLYLFGKCPSIVFGPGDTVLAHQLHETVKVDNILRVAQILAKSIVDFALTDS